ncbi:12465_t:CDS:2 [Entrophospora sp. SA101]|nr:12465_t:CDS:2 [Entrophospora sp. SA101]
MLPVILKVKLLLCLFIIAESKYLFDLHQNSQKNKSSLLKLDDLNNNQFPKLLRNAISNKDLELALDLYYLQKDDINNYKGLLYLDYVDLIQLLKEKGLSDPSKIDKRLKQMERAKRDLIKLQITHDIEIYNLIISTYFELKRYDGIWDNWRIILQQNETHPKTIIPNNTTLKIIVDSFIYYKDKRNLKEFKRLYELFKKRRFKLDDDIYLSFVKIFGDFGSVNGFEMVFKDYLKIKFYDLKPLIFDELIIQYIRNDLDINGALKIYELMIKKTLTPSRKSLIIILNTYFELNRFEEAENFFNVEIKKRWNINNDIAIINLMISGNFKIAEHYSNKNKNSSKTYDYLINSHIRKAIEWYYYVLNNNEKIELNYSTFNVLIKGFGRFKKLDQVKNCLKEMIDLNIKPNLTTFEILADIYTKHRDLQSVLLIWKDLMKIKSSLNPTFNTWIVFIKSLILCNKVDLALEFMKRGQKILNKDWKDRKLMEELFKGNTLKPLFLPYFHVEKFENTESSTSDGHGTTIVNVNRKSRSNGISIQETPKCLGGLSSSFPFETQSQVYNNLRHSSYSTRNVKNESTKIKFFDGYYSQRNFTQFKQGLQKEQIKNDNRIEITDRAVKKLLSITKHDNDHNNNKSNALRIRVDSGGCHGFQYFYDLVKTNSLKEDDVVFDKNGAKVIIDEISLGLIKGSKIDYTEELIGSQFQVIDNPQAVSGCGCGISFEVKL